MNLKKLEERLNQKFKGKEYLDKFKVIPDIMEIIAEKKNITTLKLQRLPSKDNIRTMIIETDVGDIVIKNKATKKSAFQLNQHFSSYGLYYYALSNLLHL